MSKPGCHTDQLQEKSKKYSKCSMDHVCVCVNTGIQITLNYYRLRHLPVKVYLWLRCVISVSAERAKQSGSSLA